MNPALASHLWQSTWFAVAVGLLTLLFRRNRARVRFALWIRYFRTPADNSVAW
jgi:bla regulator protein blaR1